MNSVADNTLELLNSLEIVEGDADGEFLYFALVESTEENLNILAQAGITQDEISRSTDSEGYIDLTGFIWEYAKWFDGEKFLKEVPNDA